jgi:hypothetical protein
MSCACAQRGEVNNSLTRNYALMIYFFDLKVTAARCLLLKFQSKNDCRSK